MTPPPRRSVVSVPLIVFCPMYSFPWLTQIIRNVVSTWTYISFGMLDHHPVTPFYLFAIAATMCACDFLPQTIHIAKSIHSRVVCERKHSSLCPDIWCYLSICILALSCDTYTPTTASTKNQFSWQFEPMFESPSPLDDHRRYRPCCPLDNVFCSKYFCWFQHYVENFFGCRQKP